MFVSVLETPRIYVACVEAMMFFKHWLEQDFQNVSFPCFSCLARQAALPQCLRQRLPPRTPWVWRPLRRKASLTRYCYRPNAQSAMTHSRYQRYVLVIKNQQWKGFRINFVCKIMAKKIYAYCGYCCLYADIIRYNLDIQYVQDFVNLFMVGILYLFQPFACWIYYSKQKSCICIFY